MDPISMGKSKAALKKIQDLDQNVVAPMAEDRFATVQDRLNWLEQQATSIRARNSAQVDLSQGKFTGTEYSGGQLKLKAVGTNQYLPSGQYESPVIDLTQDYLDTKLVNLMSNIPSGCSVLLEVCSSTDGVNFSNWTAYDPNNIPQTRYLKLRVTLNAPSTVIPTNLSFDQSNPQNTFVLDSYTQAYGSLRLITDYTRSMTNHGAVGSGTLFSAVIDKTAFKSIEKVRVN